ncbi:MAG TPA: hypothetical protein VIK69_09110 [Methylophilaceae bacterium]
MARRRWPWLYRAKTLPESGGGGGGLLEAKLNITATSGPVPFAFTLESTQTLRAGWTQDEVFRDVTFTFEVVGLSGTYETTGKPRYTQSGGPVAGFCILTPGTYTVRVTADDGDGNTDVAEVSVEAIDPDVYWTTGGRTTEAFSTSGDFTGAPAEATQTTASSVGTVVSNRRYLLRAGETFSSITIPMGVSNVAFEAFGSGTKPFVTSINAGESLSRSDWPHHVIIRGLRTRHIEFNTTGYEWTICQNDIEGPATADSMLSNSGALDYYLDWSSRPLSEFYHPNRIHVFENVVDGSPASPGSPGITMHGIFCRSSIVANVIDHAEEHSLRVWMGCYLFIGHNDLGGTALSEIRHALKLHSRGSTLTYSDSIAEAGRRWTPSQPGGQASINIVIADNLGGTGPATGQYTFQLGPQNTDDATLSPPYGTVEILKNVIVERNVFTRGSNWVQDLNIVGVNCTMRENTTSSGSAFHCFVSWPEDYPLNGSDAAQLYMRANGCGPYFGQGVT